MMAEALAMLPCKVLWRLSPREIPDEAAIAGLNVGNNTKVGTSSTSVICDLSHCPECMHLSQRASRFKCELGQCSNACS